MRHFWAFGFIAAAAIVAAAVATGDLRGTRLSPVQAHNIWRLIAEGRFGVEFLARQRAQTTGTLFRLGGGSPRDHFAAMSTVNENNGTLSLRFGRTLIAVDGFAGDERDHRVAITLVDGKLEVTVDCVRVADEPLEMEAVKKSLKKATATIGVAADSTLFPGEIREFSADLPKSLVLSCPEIKVPTQSRMTRQSIGDEQSLSDGDELAVAAGDIADGGDLSSRLLFLENEFSHMRRFVHRLDEQMKSMQLHQRGCSANGRLMMFGEKRRDEADCSECQCSATGSLHCGPIGCPHLQCSHPIRRDGQCCPVCGQQCFYNGAHYENGQEMWPKPCVRCRCDDGRMECKFHRVENCPALDCPETDVPPNQCCPVCVNRDHCAAGLNPCHRYADCSNGPFGAICRCRSGFFGNGTICYDVDECLWDESAREQLGGCGLGTLCINLPGSFKCDCLPGFRRLDQRSCLDLIRI